LYYLGHMEIDDAVWQALRRRRPLIVEHRDAKVTKNLEKIVRRLLALESEKLGSPEAPKTTEQQTLYEVLELDPGASDEEIRRAHKRMREIYANDSIAICGLYAPERLEVVHERLEVAHDVLLDPERRKRYDLELFPGGVPRRPPVPHPVSARADETPHPATVLPREPEIGPGTEFTGQLLRAIREARGLDLGDVAQRTKINIAYLRAIEEERWEAMPALVYARGFLLEYARTLRLDPQRVVRSFFERLQRAGEGAG
jgi:flagellar biosynthesis protein FlhG